MATDGIESERRRRFRERLEFAVRDEAELDERLETVANAEDEAVSIRQKIAERVFQERMAEEGGDEFAAAVRFVAGREAAGEHDDLRFFDARGHVADAFGKLCGVAIADDGDVRLRTGGLKSARAVDFAICSRHDGEEDARFRRFRAGVNRFDAVPFRKRGHGCFRFFRVKRENGSERRFRRGQEVGNGNGLAEERHRVAEERREAEDVRAFLIFGGLIFRAGDENRAAAGREVFGNGERIRKGSANPVSESHLRRGHRDAAVSDRFHRGNATACGLGVQEIGVRFENLRVGHAVRIRRDVEEEQRVALVFPILADGFGGFSGRDGEGNERRRDVQLAEGAAHGIFAADGTEAERALHRVSAEKGRDGFPVTFRRREFLEIFLEREVGAPPIRTERGEAGDGEQNGIGRAVEGAPRGELGIVAVRHEARGVRRAVAQRNLGDHAVCGRLLQAAAVGHEDGRGANRPVEALGETFLGRVFQFLHFGKPSVAHRGNGGRGRFDVFWRGDVSAFRPRGAVRIEEGAADIDNRIALPMHDEASFVRDARDDGRFQIFFGGVADEGVRIGGFHDDGHAFLRFGNGKLRAVQPFIFLRNFIEIDVDAVREFADRDGYAACAEIIAAQDETRHFAATEETLDFALGERISFLHFRAASLDGFFIELFGRAGGAAHAVASRAAAHQNDDVAGRGRFANDMARRSRCDDRADFHAFGQKSRMIIFRDFARRQADLISVGAVSFGRRHRECLLRQFSGERLRKRRARIAGPRDAHRLIHIRASRKRIADATAQARRRAAKRFDFRRVIVRLIFEKEQPIFDARFRFHLDFDRARIDFVRFIHFGELAFAAKRFHGHRRHVHQRHGPRRARAVNVGTRLPVIRKRAGNRRCAGAVVNLDVGERRIERRVAAMIGPIRIEDADFRQRGIAFLLLAIVCLDQEEIFVAHRQAELGNERTKAALIQRDKAFEDGDFFRRFIFRCESGNGSE